MDELMAELRRLGATVMPHEKHMAVLVVNGTNVHVEMEETKKGRPCYVVGGHRFTTVRNTAYYVLTVRIPEVRNDEAVRAFMHEMNAKLREAGLLTETTRVKLVELRQGGNMLCLVSQNTDDLVKAARVVGGAG